MPGRSCIGNFEKGQFLTRRRSCAVGGRSWYFVAVAILAALAAALLYALASVFQQSEAERQPADRSLRLGLLAALATRPRWLAGLCFDCGGYVCQWVALSHGSLIVVQPLLVVNLLFALPIKARLAPYRMRRWDWSGAVLTTAGLGVFLALSNPAAGRASVSGTTWAALLGVTAALAGALVFLGRESSPRWRAMAFGTAAGVVFGVTAALTKSCAHLLSLGPAVLFSSWQPYALLIAGVAGMVLSQSAFQAGTLDASLPAQSATDPVVSVLIGAFAFGEALRTGVIANTLEVLSLISVVVGIFMLAHTEAAKAAQSRQLELAHP